MEGAHPGLTLAVALAAGVLAQSVARQLRLPGIVLLLALGAGLGPEGLGWVRSDALGAALFGIVDFAVAVILFEGGLNLEISRLRRQELPIRQLVTVGAVITLFGATLAVRGFLHWPWWLAFLFGSLVVVTGPTVVTPLLRDMRLRPRVKTVLEAEGVLIDPIGAILAILVLNIALVPEAKTFASESLHLFFRLAFGLAAGVVAGFLIGWLLRFRFLVPQGFQNIFTLAAVFLIFQGCDLVTSHSGLMAVTIAGVVIGNLRTPVDRDLREFKDQLTVLLVGLLFILLAADVRWEDVRNLGWDGAAVIAALVLVVRPLNVWLSTLNSDLTVRERLFIACVAPRGIVAAAIASLTAASLASRGSQGGSELRALVFLTIAGTVALAGMSARPLATLLTLRLPRRDRVAIVGAKSLGLALAGELRDAGVDVVFLDSDPKRCHEAEEAGYAVVYGDALHERTLLRAQMELVGTAVGLTSNDHFNSLFVQQARELFAVPKGYVAVGSLQGREAPQYVQRHDAEVLFEGPHDVDRWDVRFRHGEVALEHCAFHPHIQEAKDQHGRHEDKVGERQVNHMGPTSNERFVILAVKRGDHIAPMTLGYQPKEGDVASIAVYIPERPEAIRVLREAGWHAYRPEPERDGTQA